MKKAKTNRKLFTILSAILGVVFAFTMGVTYCLSDLNYIFGTHPKSTTAFMGNQQYIIVNDTLENPIHFSEGSHNFEIAIQYSIDYNFDFMLEYSLSWSGGNSVSTDNVILRFANRDSFIVDEDYIYYVGSSTDSQPTYVTSGSGKLPIITGVDFVDPTDETYKGQSLTINIEKVKFYKQGAFKKSGATVYDGDHPLYVEGSEAAEGWVQRKNYSSISGAYVMVYNYRRDYTHGIPFPGAKTAYKKPTTGGVISGSKWTGGNRAYAGTGAYIITGNSPVKIEIQVGGIWRTDKNVNTQIYESSIQYNYTKDWTNTGWTDTKLFESRKYNYTIPANTACYVEFLDSIEITSAGHVSSNKYDSYRLITNNIILNPSLTTSTTIEYTSLNENLIKAYQISNNSALTTSGNYNQEDVTIINNSLHNNGLYEASGNLQTFNTNISLINNTNVEKTVTISAYNLYYHISNGDVNLLTNNARATQFTDHAYFSEIVQANSNLSFSNKISKVVIAPYSSVNIVDSYSIDANLKETIKTKYDDTDTTAEEYYDVWVYVVPTITVSTAESSTNLVVESKTTGSEVVVSVKNTSNKVLSNITAKVKITVLTQENYELITNPSAPNDWDSSYWKYYTTGTDGKLVPVETKPDKYLANVYKERFLIYDNLTIETVNLLNKFTVTEDDNANNEGSTGMVTYTSSTLSLRPGESAVIGSVATTSKQVVVTGTATATTRANANTLMLINDGKNSAYIMNGSSTSYYVRLNGTLAFADSNYATTLANFINSNGYNYYIGIIRPGELIKVPMTTKATNGTTINSIVASGNYTDTTLSSWSISDNIKTAMNNYFTQK